MNTSRFNFIFTARREEKALLKSRNFFVRDLRPNSLTFESRRNSGVSNRFLICTNSSAKASVFGSSNPINLAISESSIGVSALTEGAIISWIQGFQYTEFRDKSHTLREQPTPTQSSRCFSNEGCPGERFSTSPSSRKWKGFWNRHYRFMYFSFKRHTGIWCPGSWKPFRPTGVCVADHYVWDEPCASSTERRLRVRVSQNRDKSEELRVKGSQDTLLTRRPGRCRKPGNFFKRKGERKKDYHEHPYWFGTGTTHSQL